MIDGKYLTTAFLAGMEWERSKNKLPIREAIAICVARIKDKAAQQGVQRSESQPSLLAFVVQRMVEKNKDGG